MDLKIHAEKINKLLDKRREEISLQFYEETHSYVMKDVYGNLKDDYPSVSKIIKNFYPVFEAEKMALRMSQGDVEKQKLLLEKWKFAGDYSTNLGSRVHYELEKEIINRNGGFKSVRQPIFECDDTQLEKSDRMISAGKSYIDLMESRNVILLDTEIVLGDNELSYTGQPDKIWLVNNKENDDFGFIITDWKTNQVKNFEVQHYTKKMYKPFDNYDDTSLSHYYLQLCFYARLFLKMLKGTEYGDKKFLGGIIVLLKDDSTYKEYRIPKDVIKKVFDLDIKKIINYD